MTTITKTFKSADLKEMGLPDDAPEGGKIISDEISEHRRWTVTHRLIVHFPDQPENEAWLMHYSVGATESQDERPWEYDKEVMAVLVREKEVAVKKWLPVVKEDT